MLTPPAATEKLVIRREMPIRQDDFNPAPTSSYQPEEVELTFDRGVALTQQVDEVNNRTIQLQLGTAVTDPVLPDGANKFIKFNSAGDGFEVEDIDLTSQQAQIDSNTTNIAINAGNIAANAAADAAQDVNIGNNAAAIAANTGDIGNNAADILNLQNEQVVQNGRLDVLEAQFGNSYIQGSFVLANNTVDQIISALNFNGATDSSVMIRYEVDRHTDDYVEMHNGFINLFYKWYPVTDTSDWVIENGIYFGDIPLTTFGLDVVSPGVVELKASTTDMTGANYTGKIKYHAFIFTHTL